MVTATAQIKFLLHGCRSLKEKRSVLRRIIDRTHNRFKVSIAEVDCQDIHGRGHIGIAVVSNSRRYANSVLDEIVRFITDLCLVDITAVEIDFFQPAQD